MPSQKIGMPTPVVAIKTSAWSKKEPRLTALIMPVVMPRTMLKIRARKDRYAVVGETFLEKFCYRNFITY